MIRSPQANPSAEGCAPGRGLKGESIPRRLHRVIGRLQLGAITEEAVPWG